MPSHASTTASPPESPRRLSDTARDSILQHRFDGSLPLGAFVSQGDLTALTGVPVSPLRDALRSLEAERILTIQPRSGIKFVKPGFELTKSTFQFRQILECAAIRIFAEAAPTGALDETADRHLALSNEIKASDLSDQESQRHLGLF